jgi:amino acid transporter
LKTCAALDSISPVKTKQFAVIFRARSAYVGTSARITFGMGRNRYIPQGFARLSARGVPVLAIAFSFLLGMIVFLPFPGWQQLVGFISSAIVLAYGRAPLALGALRRQEPDRDVEDANRSIRAKYSRAARAHAHAALGVDVLGDPRDAVMGAHRGYSARDLEGTSGASAFTGMART